MKSLVDFITENHNTIQLHENHNTIQLHETNKNVTFSEYEIADFVFDGVYVEVDDPDTAIVKFNNELYVPVIDEIPEEVFNSRDYKQLEKAIPSVMWDKITQRQFVKEFDDCEFREIVKDSQKSLKNFIKYTYSNN